MDIAKDLQSFVVGVFITVFLMFAFFSGAYIGDIYKGKRSVEIVTEKPGVIVVKKITAATKDNCTENDIYKFCPVNKND